jgi:hypothetical protein
MLAEATIEPKDLSMLWVTDSVEDAVARIHDVGVQRFGLSYVPRPKRRWWMGEFGGR